MLIFIITVLPILSSASVPQSVELNYNYNFFGATFKHVYIHPEPFISFDNCSNFEHCKNAVLIINSEACYNVLSNHINETYELHKFAQLIRNKHDMYFGPQWGFKITFINRNKLFASIQLILLWNKYKSFLIIIYGDNIQESLICNEEVLSGLKVNNEIIYDNLTLSELGNLSNTTKKGVWVKKVDRAEINNSLSIYLISYNCLLISYLYWIF